MTAQLKLISNETEAFIDSSKIGKSKNPLIKRLIDYERESQRSWEVILNAIGINERILSYFLDDKPITNKKEVEQKIKNFLDAEERYLFQVPKNLLYCKTTNSELINHAIGSCNEQRIIGLVVGDPGFGKSTAARLITDDINGSYFELNKESMTRTRLLSQLTMRFLNNNSYNLNTNIEKLEGLIRYFNKKNTVLVIDQADYMNADSIDILRTISESAEIGLCLIGLPGIRRKLSSRSAEVRQLRDRIILFIELEQPTKEDFINVINTNWLGLEDEIIKEFIRLSRGTLRRLSTLIFHCRTFLALEENRGKELTADIVKDSNLLLLNFDDE